MYISCCTQLIFDLLNNKFFNNQIDMIYPRLIIQTYPKNLYRFLENLYTYSDYCDVTRVNPKQ